MYAIYVLYLAIVWTLLEFPALVMIFPVVFYKVYERIELIFFISAQIYSNFSKFSENSCAGMVIFAISPLLLTIFLIIRVFLSKSHEYSMYSVPLVNLKMTRCRFSRIFGSFSPNLANTRCIQCYSGPCCIL